MERKTFIQTFVLGSGFVMVNPVKLLSNEPDKNTIRISMIYNNMGKDPDLKSAWGLSVWVETGKSTLLFDTGGDPKILSKNLDNTHLDINRVSKIFISHRHWDHLNGLESVLEKHSGNPDVYVVEHALPMIRENYPNAKLIPISSAQAIETNVWSTGELPAEYRKNELWEHSMILVQDDSLVLLTGCSHPGIVEITKKTKQLFPEKTIELIAGGFHLGSKSKDEIKEISEALMKLDVQKIAPSHCTGDKAVNYFKNSWGERFLALNLGDAYKT
jgi:7,8-dihydropterin-6-yl-methyl-4-(beta-D-ribofuranosyl)aminobenzene 5'-phosphate synthase